MRERQRRLDLVKAKREEFIDISENKKNGHAKA
jgi:hypothetical protein